VIILKSTIFAILAEALRASASGHCFA